MKNGIFLVMVLFGIFVTYSSCKAPSPPPPVQEDEVPDYPKQFEQAYAQLRIAEPSQRQEQQPLVLAHYMPWFQKYGFHWQEGGANFDPAQILPDGKANIASHYYPLTGNYDSIDTAVLDYQLALMKIAGIDGVIFDWYGITEGIDYKPIHEATLVMIDMIKKRGLKYAICYEDQSIKHLIDFGIVPRDQGRATAKETFEWMEKNWFANAEYIKIEGRPLVLCFGPQQFNQKAEWDEIWSGLKNRPFFIDLDARSDWADGTQNWSPMHLSTSTGGRLSIPNLVQYLNDYYKKEENKSFVVGTALPGFHDIYAQAGKRSYGFLDYFDGETFKLSWTAAERARANVIQIQTWNDYGEGTIIEPTIERGYKCLEFIQDKRMEWEPDFPFNYSDLRVPIELFKILAARATEEQKNQVADMYDFIFTGNALGLRQALRAANIRYDMTASPLLQRPSGETETVVVFDPEGRSNLALRKPVYASSRIDVYVPNRSVDGNVSSYWEGAARAWPGTLHVDLEAMEKITTVVIKLNPQRMWSKRIQRIEVMVADNDELNWTVAVPEADYEFDPEANANTVVIPMNVTTRYVQLVFTANSGATNGQVAEFEVYGE
jgi:hypothetical protein